MMFFARIQGDNRPSIFKLHSKNGYLGTFDGKITKFESVYWTDYYADNAMVLEYEFDRLFGSPKGRK